MNQLTKDLAHRNIQPSSAMAVYARPIGSDGVASYSSSSMTCLDDQIDQQEMSAWFRICASSEDDDGDIVEPSGMDLSRYKSNPIVLFHHDKESPAIGLSEDRNKQLCVSVRPNEIIAKCFFHGLPFDGKNLSQEIFDLVVRGAIRGASVGFLPIQAKKRGYGDEAGYHFHRSLLTEWSITPIPSNAETLRMCLSRGYVKSLELKTHLEKFATPLAQYAHGADLSSGGDGSKPMKQARRISNVTADRGVFKSLQDAIATLKTKGYDVSAAEELPTLFVFRQSDVEPSISAGVKEITKGLTAHYGYVSKAKADDVEEDKDDEEESETASETPTEENQVEKSEEEVNETPVDETNETEEEQAEEDAEGTEDHSQKPGAQDLKNLGVHFQALLDNIPDMLGRNENPKVRKILDRLNVDAQNVLEDLREVFTAQYPGANFDEAAAQTPETEVEEPEAEEMAMDDDEVYKRLEKKLTRLHSAAGSVAKNLQCA